MAVISMVPLVGTNLILVPAGTVLILQGRVVAGLVIILVGLAGVAVTQNIIKPKLLGDRSGLHPALALLAILGGIAWLGIVGFVIGPLLVSLFIVIWEQFGRRYRSALDSRNHTE
jgi:predicted PurR-regulated permease PerM